MSSRSSRNGAAHDPDDIPDALERPAPTLAKLSAEPSLAELAQGYGSLCAHYHAERVAIIDRGHRSDARLTSIETRLSSIERRTGVGVSTASFVVVCIAALLSIASNVWLALRH